jgi:hypothetical protein
MRPFRHVTEMAVFLGSLALALAAWGSLALTPWGTTGPAAAAGGGGENKYAPKVFTFGEVYYHGPETINCLLEPLIINKNGYYKLVGWGVVAPSSIPARVLVQPGVSADILIENLMIDASDSPAYSPIQISPGAKATLRLAGNNFLKAGGDYAAIAAPEGATLTITSAAGDGSLSGALEAIGVYGAGIGGSRCEAGGNITINGGTIHATGGNGLSWPTNVCGGAGIGGGGQGDGGTIVINGGAVSAYVSCDDYGAACIGGGGSNDDMYAWDGGEAGNITITGGVVQAITSSWGGTGIGSGYTPRNANVDGKIMIAGGVVTALGNVAAGIGAGYKADGGTITIRGGFVDASTGGDNRGQAAIGSAGSDYDIIPNNTIAISGGSVIARGAAGYGTSIGPSWHITQNKIVLSGGTVFGLGGEYPIGQGRGGFTSVDIFAGAGGLVLLAQNGVYGHTSSPNDGIMGSPDLTYDDATKTITLSTDMTIPAGATLAVPAGYTLNLNGYTLTNDGLVLNKGVISGDTGGAILSFNNGGGTFSASASASLFDGFYLAHGETLTISAGQTVTIPASFDATNDGVIVLDGGTLNIVGNLKNRGLVMYKSGSVNGDTNNRGGFGTGGTLTLSGDRWIASGIAPLPGGFDVGASQDLVVPAGETAVIQETAANNGTIKIEPDGSLLLYGTLTNNGTLDNAGTLDNKGTIENFGTILDYGMFVN